jgi:hypothetical protein
VVPAESNSPLGVCNSAKGRSYLPGAPSWVMSKAALLTA